MSITWPVLWLIIPAKALDTAKSRLAPALSNDERATFSLFLTRRTLDIAAEACHAQIVARFCIVSPDETLLAEAQSRGGLALLENPVPNDASPDARLNAALTQAATYAVQAGADAVLILPTDLPYLSMTDIAELARLASVPASVVIAPDTHDDGTNALLVAPPLALPFAFGSHSFRRHLTAATQHNLTVQIVRRPGLAFDVDHPADLHSLR